jgi:hypothetical protein
MEVSLANYYVAWIRWRKKVRTPVGKGHGKNTIDTIESGEEIYPITAETDKEAIADAKNAIAPSQARGEANMERRILKLWKVEEIKIPE